MNIESTSNIAAKTKGQGVSTSIKELDHEAAVKCRFASIISKSKALCDNGSKKFDPQRMKQEEATLKPYLLEEKPTMEAQPMKTNVGLKRKREVENGRKKADPQPSFQRRKKAVIKARQTKANVPQKRERKMDRNAARIAKIDPEKMKQEETEKSQKKLVDEKAVVDADLQRQPEMDRNSARIAMEKMENTAGIEINVDTENEFYMLLGVSYSYPKQCRDGAHHVL